MQLLQKIYIVMIKVFDFIDDKILMNIQWIMAAMMVICMAVNLVARWIIGRSLGELDEIALIGYLYLIFLGMCKLYRTDGNITMNFFIERLHGVAKKLLLLFDAIVVSAVSTYMTILSYRIMIKSFNRTLNITHIPYSYTHLAFLIGFSILALCTYANALKLMIDIFAPNNSIPAVVVEHNSSAEGDAGAL